jgi:hypothetical protein
MEVNRIMLDVPENARIVAGPGPGEEAYKKCKGQIDDEAKNIICFPKHVTRIIGSFFTGFFKELKKNMTSGEIKEHFDFDSNMPCYESAIQAFEKYISSNK